MDNLMQHHARTYQESSNVENDSFTEFMCWISSTHSLIRVEVGSLAHVETKEGYHQARFEASLLMIA